MDKSNSTKTPLSEKERLELAAKLDRDLDDFIGSLHKRAPQDMPSYDRWEEDLMSHPFFMNDGPQLGDKMHPLYEALQKLKYDPEENEPEELAQAYRDDGNFNFKHKKYRMAIIAYNEGLKVKCGNPDIEATLYNNTSAAHYFLQNYRSSLINCEKALKLKPDYYKTLIRAAECCSHLENYGQAMEYCQRALEKDPDGNKLHDLLEKYAKLAQVKARDIRKKQHLERRRKKEEDAIVNEIKARGINVEGSVLTLGQLEPRVEQLLGYRVHLNELGGLEWPVVLFYPEYKIREFIQQFCEQDSFVQHLEMMFNTQAPWDHENKYKVPNINVYFESKPLQLVKVKVKSTLLNVLSMKSFIVREGTPSFIALVKDSDAEKQFLVPYTVIA